MKFARVIRALAVMLFFASVGLLVFYVDSLLSGDWNKVWERKGIIGALLWAYEHTSILAIVTLFILGFACAWMPFNRLLAALSLGLFYPMLAIVQIAIGTHTGNVLPLEFIGYLFIIGVCLIGYATGRTVFQHLLRSAPSSNGKLR